MTSGSEGVLSVHARIVHEITQHNIDFVELPHRELGYLPVCPFARKARLENRIRFEVLALTRENVLALVPSFLENSKLQVMTCIHPRKHGLSWAEVRELVEVLNPSLLAVNLMALGLHPDDPFNIDGLYTRREPYPNVQIIRLEEGERAHESIRNSGYYDLWTESNLRDCLYSHEESVSILEDHAKIVREFKQHMIDFVEQPHAKLGNLPVCPFARKARLARRIQFEITELTRERVLILAESFTKNPQLQVMICIDPRKDVSYAETQRLVKELNKKLPTLNLMALGGHPEDTFNIDGLYTRRDPHPNVQLIRLDVGERAHLSIKCSGYYDRWTESNFRDVALGESVTASGVRS